MLGVRSTSPDLTFTTMKKLALFTVLVVTAGLLNVGCSVSGSVKPTSAVTPATSARVAYTTAPAK